MPVEPGEHSLPPFPLVLGTREAVALSLVVDRLHLDSGPPQPGMNGDQMTLDVTPLRSYTFLARNQASLAEQRADSPMAVCFATGAWASGRTAAA